MPTTPSPWPPPGMGPEMLEQSLAAAPALRVAWTLDARNIMSGQRAGVPRPPHTRGRRGAPSCPTASHQTSGELDDGAGEDAGGVRRYAGAGAGGEIHASCWRRILRRHAAASMRWEYVMIPETGEKHPLYHHEAGRENERGNTTRLMKVKDMVLQDAHHYQT